MRKDRQRALRLRLGGKSYGEITKTLGVPKSTLSGWFSNLVISSEAKKKIEERGYQKSISALIRRNKQQTVLAVRRALDNRQQGAQVIDKLTKRDLCILGASLYWAEGYKRPIVKNGREVTHHRISLTNSDSKLVKTFLRFLREYCGVSDERIKASVRVFPHQNNSVLQRYWQRETKLPLHNITVLQAGLSRSSSRKRPFNRLPYGVIQILVSDTRLFHRIMGHIEGIKKFV